MAKNADIGEVGRLRRAIQMKVNSVGRLLEEGFFTDAEVADRVAEMLDELEELRKGDRWLGASSVSEETLRKASERFEKISRKIERERVKTYRKKR